jgi:hypothetical protein
VASINGIAGDPTSWKSALEVLDGIIECDVAGSYSVWTPLASLVSDDSTYGGGAQSVAASVDSLAAAIAANAGDIATNDANITINANDIATINALDGVVIGDGEDLSATSLTDQTTDYLAGDGTFQTLPSGAAMQYGELYGSDTTVFDTDGTWYQLGSSLSTGIINGFSASTAVLTYTGSAGQFQVQASMSGLSASSADTFEFAIAVNGTIQTKSIQTKDLAVGGDADITLSCLLDLSNDDQVDVRGRALAAASVSFNASRLNFNLMN